MFFLQISTENKNDLTNPTLDGDYPPHPDGMMALRLSSTALASTFRQAVNDGAPSVIRCTGGARRYAWFGQDMVKDAEAHVVRSAKAAQQTSFWRAKSYPEFTSPPNGRCAHQTMRRIRASDAFGLHSPWKVHSK